MHKGFELLDGRHKQEEMPNEVMKSGKKNIIFLDIDGVIQPYNHEYRFSHNLDRSLDMLRETCDPALVDEGDPWDIVAAYYDWDEIAMGRLAKICRHCGAYIVLHSSWIQFNSLERFKLFFSFFGLADYVLDKCPELTREEQTEEQEMCDYHLDEKAIKIRKWLKIHEDEVRDYIVIDDYDMSWSFGGHFLRTRDRLKEADYQTCLGILSGNKSIKHVDEMTISSGGTYARYRIDSIGSVRGVFFTTEFPDRNDDRYDRNSIIVECRILVMYLMGQYFWEGRDARYDDITYFFWCWRREDEPFARREQKKIIESLRVLRWIRCGDYYVNMPFLKAAGTERLEGTWSSEETEFVYKVGLELLDNNDISGNNTSIVSAHL